jgi:hypothetical protein
MLAPPASVRRLRRLGKMEETRTLCHAAQP